MTMLMMVVQNLFHCESSRLCVATRGNLTNRCKYDLRQPTLLLWSTQDGATPNMNCAR